MLKYRHTFESGRRFTTWMYQVARNAHFDSSHKRRHERLLEEGEAEESGELASQDPTPDQCVAAGQEALLLQEALAALPLELKEVLVLSRYQNLKYEEIAGILDCSVGAVKMRMHRALKELRLRFTALVGEEVV
jgi:RNA polymerase sigma-70 factor (ECF subfamily)